MTTLTITDAKKNLGKWLSAAVHGEDVGIISGAAIVALKPVKVRIAHPVEIREIDYEYARQEYGVTKTELNRFKKDRKSTRLNSSHTVISYAVFCLKKKKKNNKHKD